MANEIGVTTKISCKVLLEGIEVPFIGVTIKSTPNAPLMFNVKITPNEVIKQIKPRTRVEVFLQDYKTFGDYQYYHACDGEVIGRGHGRTHEMRYYELLCVCTASYIEDSQLYLFNQAFLGMKLSEDVMTSTVARFNTEITATAATKVSTVTATSALVDKIVAGATTDKDGKKADILDGIVEAISFMSSANLFYKTAFGRHRILDRMRVFSAGNLVNFLSKQKQTDFLTSFTGSAGGRMGLLAYITGMMNVVFHDFMSVPFPAYIRKKYSDESSEKTPANFLFVPDAYTLPPPICNTLFPNQIIGMNFSEDFRQAPTRYRFVLTAAPLSNPGEPSVYPDMAYPVGFAEYMTKAGASTKTLYFSNDDESLSSLNFTGGKKLEQLAPKYREAYSNMQLSKDGEAKTQAAVEKITNPANRERYEAVSRATGVPWDVIACIHGREAGFDFNACLHNGEKIIGTGKKTSIEPIGFGPFETWEESAISALKKTKMDKRTSWTLEETLHAVEGYNGFGYANKGRPSPYLWAGTNYEAPGKYVSDGVFDPNAKDAQFGVAAVMKSLESQGIIAPRPLMEGVSSPPQLNVNASQSADEKKIAEEKNAEMLGWLGPARTMASEGKSYSDIAQGDDSSKAVGTTNSSKLSEVDYLSNEESFKGIYFTEDAFPPAYSTLIQGKDFGEAEKKFIYQVGKYLFYKKRYASRPVSAQIRFNPFLVPGFNAMLIDSDSSGQTIIAKIMSLEHSIMDDQVATNIELGYGRDFDEIDIMTGGESEPTQPSWFDPSIFGAKNKDLYKAEVDTLQKEGYISKTEAERRKKHPNVTCFPDLGNFYKSLLGVGWMGDYISLGKNQNRKIVSLRGAADYYVGKYKRLEEKSPEEAEQYVRTQVARPIATMSQYYDFLKKAKSETADKDIVAVRRKVVENYVKALEFGRGIRG